MDVTETILDIPDHNTYNKDEIEMYARKKGTKGQYIYDEEIRYT
jgi:hypothetical protein